MKLTRIITEKNLNSTSALERIGDFILTPSHLLFGKKFVYFPTGKKSIEITQDNVRLQKITHKTGSWFKTFLKIILLPAITLLPLGLLIKSISLINTNTRNAYKTSIEELTFLNLSKEVYLDLAKNPLRYFKYQSNSAKYAFEPLNLSECACRNETFNRLTSPHRMQLEERLVQDLMPLVEKKKSPRILSLGCGQLLSEFRFVGLLLSAGHTEIDLDLIDSSDESIEAVKNLKNFYDQFGISVRVQWYKNINDYKEKGTDLLKPNLDALFAMDYDEMVNDKGAAAKDFIEARKYLALNAKTYLGYSGAVVISNDNQYEFLNNSGIIQNYTRILDKELSKFNNSTLRVALPQKGQVRALELLISVTEWAKKKKIPNLEITFVEAQSLVDPALLEHEENTALKDWLDNCISQTMKIEVKQGTLSNNYFDLVGPRYFPFNNTPTSKEDLRNLIAPGGVILTLTSPSPIQLTALSHRSEHFYTMK